jgi:electron transport complex protein RnfG
MSVQLPSVSAPPGGGVSVDAEPTGASAFPVRPPTSSARLVATLALAGAVAGFFIVLVYQWAEPRIEAHRARVLAEAISVVLAEPAATEVWYLHDGGFTTAPPPEADTAAMDRVWVGRDETGAPVGVAAVAAEAGFQDVIRLIFGYDPATERVVGMKVLESKETPGLGDKIEKDSLFVAEFAGVAVPLVGVKAGKATGADDEIDMITGATISSEAIVRIINNRLDVVGEPVDRMWRGGAVGEVAGGIDAGGRRDAGGTESRVAVSGGDR